MTELLTAAQMRAIEQAAIDSGEVTGLELMERAGQGVVDAIFEEWPELVGEGEVDTLDAHHTRGPAPTPPRYLSQKEGPLRAVVLCGPGNNGGDGFVVARLLHERGWVVEVFLYGDAEKLPPDARLNYERWLELGEVLTYIDEGKDAFWLDPAIYRENTIVIDAIFGTGLSRPIKGLNQLGWLSAVTEWKLLDVLRTRSYPACRIVSVDMPSGVCADSGKMLTEPNKDIYHETIEADLTVTFHAVKTGHHLAGANEFVSKVRVVNIGISQIGLPGAKSREIIASTSGEAKIGRVICRLNDQLGNDYFSKAVDENKFIHGHALCLSGNTGQTGAARLAARGALRIGAGLVTLGVPSKALQEAASHLTAIMLKSVATAEDLTSVLQDKRINALCLGPGLGLDRAKPLVTAAFDAGLEARPTVLDADALSAFANEPEALFELLHEECVLTPHGGEFARLFPDIAEKLNSVPIQGPAYSKVDATRDAAKRAGCIVLFKGADTVIAAPDGRCSINSAHYERSAPWLATAGSGDVLAGFITGLLARGFAPMQAAETAAWLHVECALKFGPGLIAEDIPEQLPAVFRDLGL